MLKAEYKTIVIKKRRQFEIKHVSNIENLQFSKPKEFWKYFKTKDEKLIMELT